MVTNLKREVMGKKNGSLSLTSLPSLLFSFQDEEEKKTQVVEQGRQKRVFVSRGTGFFGGGG